MRPVLLGAHLGDDRATAVEDAHQIHVDDAAPLVDRIFPQRMVGAGDAGVADQDVDATELAHSGCCRALDLGRVGDVDGDGVHASLGTERTRRRLEEVGVQVPQGDGCARREKALGDRAAETFCAAGDYGATSVEIDLVQGGLGVQGVPEVPRVPKVPEVLAFYGSKGSN